MSDHAASAPAGRPTSRPVPAGLPSIRFTLALALLAPSCILPGAASAQPPRARGVVYVESDDPAGNAVLAFRRHDDGSLTPLPGSPFPTGGRGITPTFNLGPFDSDQEVIINREHTLLFAVNGGSDSIAVFHIEPDGSLTPVDGSPFPSGGSNPVSVGLSGDDVLCVVVTVQCLDYPSSLGAGSP